MVKSKVWLLPLLVMFIQGCANTNKQHFDSVFVKGKKEAVSEDKLMDDDGKKDASKQPGGSSSLQSLQASESLDAETSSKQLALSDEKDITVSFEQLDLKEFVNHSLANVLKANFVIDPQAKLSGQKVTLSIKDKVSQSEYLALFKDVLQQNGLSMKIRNDVVFLHPASRRRGLPEYDFGYGKSKVMVPQGSQPVFQVVPLEYIDQKSLSSFIIRLSNASPENMTDPNLIGLKGTRHDVLRALDIVNMVDVPHVRGRHIQFVKLEYLPSSEFISQVTELLENEGVEVTNSLRFADLSRQNGVIVHSTSETLLSRVEFWRKQLDTPESTEDKQYFMYYPENMEAVKLADVLQKLASVAAGGSASTTKRATGSTDSVTGQSNTTAANSSSASSGSAGDFSYVVDENRNVIIVYANASKYKSLLPLLKKLDVTPSQVLIEARLIEITLTDQYSQGIEWSLFGGGAKRNINTSQLTSFANGSFSYTISGVDYNAALNLLESQDRLKVLSSPRIVVANGESATLNVGTEIPVLSTQAADVDSDRVLQSIQYRSTGVDLSVEPTVNSSNVISMKVSQNVSETSENASSGIDSPLILNRSFQTYVIANSGQTLVLGGLIRENNSSDDSSVPFLGDIPVVGNLFKSDSRSTSRTELVVLITPRIISNTSDIDDVRKLFLDELTLFD